MTKPEPENPSAPAVRPEGDLRDRARPWVRNVVLVLAGVIVILLIAYAAAAFIPRWWAQRIGDQVDDRMSAGILWGLFYGALFTFVPLLVAAQARRPMFKPRMKIAVVVLALVLALPNLMTLAVVLGTNNAAHAGERIMDVRAPGFRWATFSGAVAGIVLALVVVGASVTLRRRKHQVKDLRGQIRERDAAQKPPRDDSAGPPSPG